MKIKHILQCIVIIIILTCSLNILFPINNLSVRDPDNIGSKLGYIDRATLIVEPRGGYTEQSLYLWYSDHNQFPGNDKIEVIHRFELPQGSVVNDLWLWIGDSVMQAIMLDTWTARAIYDSIVDVKLDPAFLSKNGNQYELRIYPLESGSFRRIKMNYITPTKWRGRRATTLLPYKFLNSNNTTSKPLEILFRTHENIWGEPVLLEEPDLTFTPLIDTLNYHFKYCALGDISPYEQLTLEFTTNFKDGYFFNGSQIKNEPSYFQLGLLPVDFFNLQTDTSSQKCAVGLDLSGNYNRNLDLLIPKIEDALISHLKKNDKFKIIVTGNGQLQHITSDWTSPSFNNIHTAFNEFQLSDFAEELNNNRIPHILYCDGSAAGCWRWASMDIATWEKWDNIMQARHRFKHVDIIAAYQHGYDNLISQQEAELVIASLDSVFKRGGRFLTFYDYNRVGREKLASYYIPGLTTNKKISGTLYRNLDGNIGEYFPESVFHPQINILEYHNDPDVKIELMDEDGKPAVISKKIYEGLLVVSGLWAFGDDPALRELLGVPLLGLNQVSSHFQLTELLEEVKTISSTGTFSKSLIFSNSDSLILQTDAENWVDQYLSSFQATTPVFNSINLLDGTTITPAYQTINNVDYYGSGYLLKHLADETRGVHSETHINDWDFISALTSVRLIFENGYVS